MHKKCSISSHTLSLYFSFLSHYFISPYLPPTDFHVTPLTPLNALPPRHTLYSLITNSFFFFSRTHRDSNSRSLTLKSLVFSTEPHTQAMQISPYFLLLLVFGPRLPSGKSLIYSYMRITD